MDNDDPLISHREVAERRFKEIFRNLIAKGVDKSKAAALAIMYIKDSDSCHPTGEKIHEHVNVQHIYRMVEYACIMSDFTAVVNLVVSVFSSPGFLGNKLFSSSKCKNIENEVDSEDDTVNSAVNVTINIEEVYNLYNTLLSTKNNRIRDSLSNALEDVAKYLNLASSVVAKKPISDQSIIHLYIIILEYPELLDPRYEELLRDLFHAMDRSSKECRAIWNRWLRQQSKLVGEERFRRYVNVMKQHITLRLYQGGIDDARICIRILQTLHAVHHLYSNISMQDFYVDALNQDYMTTSEGRKREFLLWREEQRHSNKSDVPKQSLMAYPFVLSPAIKATVLELDAELQMRLEVEEEFATALSSGARFVIPFLILRVRRDYIIPDTLSHMLGFADKDYKKPLKVVFDGEEGVDAGGVRKEFFQVAMRELLDLNFGMFKYHEESRLLWFNPDSLETSAEFELIGVLLGIAIYNSIIIDLPMPLLVYKRLKGLNGSLEDLAQLEPTLAAGLKTLLDYEGDVQAAFGFVFQVSYELFGEVVTVNLRESTSDKMTCEAEAEPVTNENREEYVNAYVSWCLVKSVEQQFEAFARGFRKVCGGAALNLFEPVELELLVCGSPQLNFVELEKGTRYEDGFAESHAVVRYFWAELHSLDDSEKRLFLKFVSGSDRAPIEGLGGMGFVISKNGRDDHRLPSAHTCFNHLLLPEYSCQEVLGKKLRMAIHQSEGFGLR